MAVRRVLFTVLLVFAVADPAAATRPVSDAGAFAEVTDALLTEAHAALEVVPSFALTVVVGDRPVYVQAFGLADQEAKLSATGETVYYIASVTKSFTALAAALLDQRGEFDLQAPISDYLPGVQLADSLQADRITSLDLLRHTSGLDNQALVTRLAYTGEHTPELLWSLLDHTVEAEAPYGSFQYTNVGYNILGLMLDRHFGKPWQDLLRDEIFVPLGMERTTAYASRPVQQGWPMAAPYFGLHPDGPQRLYLVKQDATMQSAGGMMTTAADLARWLQMHLNDGRVGGVQVLPAEVVAVSHEKLVDTDPQRGMFSRSGYGMGWFHGTHHDQPVLEHGGGFAGFRSSVSFMPEAGIGVAVLVNEGSAAGFVVDLIAAYAYDWWLGHEDATETFDRTLAGLLERRDAFRQRMTQERSERAKREWNLTLDRAAYTGRFVHPLLGTLTVEAEGYEMVVSAGVLQCTATAYPQENTARVELVPGTGQVLVFQIEDDGVVQAVEIDGDVFTRVR